MARPIAQLLDAAPDLQTGLMPASSSQPTSPTPATPMALLQIAMSQNADIDKLTKLMELQERWESSEARKAYNAAMSKFKANPPQISKNRHVEFGNTKYDHATLDHVTDTITKALSAVGIGHRWTVNQADGAIAVTCILTHEQGHSEETTLSAPADNSGSKNAIQAIGSAVTYLQRYTLLAATGLAVSGQDTDGRTATEGISPNVVQQHVNRIYDAADMGELQKVFVAAYKAAGIAKDKRAMGTIIAAKDTRKKELAA